MKLILSILLLSVLGSCTMSTAGLSRSEKKSLDNIKGRYACELATEKGFSTDTATSDGYYKLSLSESPIVEKFINSPLLPASGVAYHFFTALNKEEQANYKTVIVELTSADGANREFSFNSEDLREVNEYLPQLELISNSIAAKDYASLHAYIDREVSPELTKEALASICFPMDSIFGAIEESSFQGFDLPHNTKMGIPLMKLTALSKRQTEIVPLSLFFDRTTSKLVGFAFNL